MKNKHIEKYWNVILEGKITVIEIANGLLHLVADAGDWKKKACECVNAKQSQGSFSEITLP